MRILKKILWVLLGLIALPLALLLFVIVLILTVVMCLGRIRYRVDANIGDNTTALIEVKYLLRLVHCVIRYKDGKFDNRIRVAWIRLGEEKPPKVKKPHKPKKTKTLPAKSHTDAQVVSTPQDDPKLKPATDAPTPPPKKSTPKSEPPSPEPEDEKKDRLKPLKQAKAVLTHPDLKTIIGLCFQCMQKLFKALKPKRLDISGVVGFDDPAATGWFMGAYEAAAGIMELKSKIRLLGSYHEKALHLDIKARGRACMGRLLWPFLWLYLKKPIRVVLHGHILRKEDQDEQN